MVSHTRSNRLIHDTGRTCCQAASVRVSSMGHGEHSGCIVSISEFGHFRATSGLPVIQGVSPIVARAVDECIAILRSPTATSASRWQYFARNPFFCDSQNLFEDNFRVVADALPKSVLF